MNFQLDLNLFEDKIEFFEAESIKNLEEKIQSQIEINKAIMLQVHSVSHQMYVSEEGRRFYSAVVTLKPKSDFLINEKPPKRGILSGVFHFEDFFIYILPFIVLFSALQFFTFTGFQPDPSTHSI